MGMEMGMGMGYGRQPDNILLMLNVLLQSIDPKFTKRVTWRPEHILS